jgi:GNAT superfamily N-acetyltransferase
MRLGRPDDARAIGELVRRVIRRWVLPDQTPEAGRALLGRMGAKAIRESMAAGRRFQLAYLGGRLVGVAAMRDDSHLTQLFVATRHHGHGIARRLWRRAMRDAVRRAGTHCFTLNATRCALPVYRRFGFVESGPERLSPNGVLSTPMRLVLAAVPADRRERA